MEIKEIFKKLENNSDEFFKYVADDVDWIVEGHHPLAGRYRSKKDFLAGTFEKLSKVLPQGAGLKLVSLMVSDDWSIAELESSAYAKNGLLFDNKYCWLTRWSENQIVEVRAYLDSALVARVFEENPI